MHRHSKRLLVATLCASGVVCWFGCARRPATEQQTATVQVVVTTPIKKSIVEWDEYVGRFDAVDFVEVRARVSGYLQSIHFEEGQIVNEGDLLFIIDPRPFAAELNRAKAQVVEAKANLAQSTAKLAEAKALKSRPAWRDLGRFFLPERLPRKSLTSNNRSFFKPRLRSKAR